MHGVEKLFLVMHRYCSQIQYVLMNKEKVGNYDFLMFV